MPHQNPLSQSLQETRLCETQELLSSRDESMDVLLNLLEPHKLAALAFKVVEKRR